MTKTFLGFVIALLSLTSLTAHAQQGRITKVKGNQAIVQFTSGPKPQVGQTVNVDEMNLSSSGSESEGSTPGGGSGFGQPSSGSRQYTLGLSSSLSFKSDSDTSRNTTHFDLSGKFGWNMVKWEAGPLVQFEYESTDISSTTKIGAGVFGDFNFVPNKPGQDLVYGVGSEMSYKSTSNSRSNISSSTLDFFLGGFLKYFVLGNSVALRADAGFDYDKTTQSNSTSDNSSAGITIKGGLQVYF